MCWQAAGNASPEEAFEEGAGARGEMGTWGTGGAGRPGEGRMPSDISPPPSLEGGGGHRLGPRHRWSRQSLSSCALLSPFLILWGFPQTPFAWSFECHGLK